MILREVFAWLRHCLSRDTLCQAQGVVVEEIVPPSTDDRNDGVRTLAIYKASQGFTPRIEIRFATSNPQVWFIGKEEKSEYVISPYTSNFSGDSRNWSRSEFVSYLVDFAKARLCNDTSVMVYLIKADTEPMRTPITLDHIKKVLKAARRAEQKNVKLDQDQVNNWLKKNTTENIDAFAKKVFEYFLKGKLTWEDLDYLENEYPPGQPIIHWGYYKKQLSDPKFHKHLPPPILDRVMGSHPVRRAFDRIVEDYRNGRDITSRINLAYPAIFGEDAQGVLASGKLPLPYLELMERCDPLEKIAPWSYIRRSIIAYKTDSTTSKDVGSAVVEWLDKSRILGPLYKADVDESLKTLVKSRIDNFAKSTVDNPSWLVSALDSISGRDPMESRKSLQAEFDMWLLHALSPSVSASKLPLSPHAFAAGKDQEDLYHKVFSTWLNRVKHSISERNNHSVKTLSSALSHFYLNAIRKWQPDLTDYTPKVPSSNRIQEALRTGKEALLDVLLSDLRYEVGTEVPSDIKNELLEDPFFNTIYREVRFQSIKL